MFFFLLAFATRRVMCDACDCICMKKNLVSLSHAHWSLGIPRIPEFPHLRPVPSVPSVFPISSFFGAMPLTAQQHYNRQLELQRWTLVILRILVGLALKIMADDIARIPYHTSALSGEEWV